MPKIDLQKLEKISDYSIALMEEISGNIKRLSQYSRASIGNNLDDINKKIDLARVNGINVDALDKQVLDFRVVLFKGDIDNKIEEVYTNLNNFAFDISKIENEYKELQKEIDIDHKFLDDKMQKLYDEVIRAKIKFMIKDFSEGEGTSVYSIDQIAEEISNAKEKNIDVDDIEDMLFG